MREVRKLQKKSWKVTKVVHNKVQGKEVRADVKNVASYLELVKIIYESGYSEQQIFHVDETAFYWKNITSRIFIARAEKPTSSFKDRLNLL